MNAIQTKYNGRFYRSRLEARYAVLFDACPLAYDYDNEGFELDQSRCLVDFWLPTLGIFFEVKGSLLVGWQHKYQSLADHSERRVVVAEGGIHSETSLFTLAPGCRGHLIEPLAAFLMRWHRPERIFSAIEIAQSARFEFGETPNVVPLKPATRLIAAAR